nr:MAG TPA: hypothetical protein [Bacteriophage sp.]
MLNFASFINFGEFRRIGFPLFLSINIILSPFIVISRITNPFKVIYNYTFWIYIKIISFPIKINIYIIRLIIYRRSFLISSISSLSNFFTL